MVYHPWEVALKCSSKLPQRCRKIRRNNSGEVCWFKIPQVLRGLKALRGEHASPAQQTECHHLRWLTEHQMCSPDDSCNYLVDRKGDLYTALQIPAKAFVSRGIRGKKLVKAFTSYIGLQGAAEIYIHIHGLSSLWRSLPVKTKAVTTPKCNLGLHWSVEVLTPPVC